MKPLPKPEKFWPRVDKTGPSGCWLWTGSCLPTGYGQVGCRVGGKTYVSSAHRVAYRFVVGPIPAGLQLDHLCRVRRCVNPAHLEPVTPRENVRRSPIVGRNERTPVISEPGALRAARHAKGLRLIDVARAVGISECALSLYERGLRTQPRGDLVARLATLLDLDPDSIARPAIWVDVTATDQVAA